MAHCHFAIPPAWNGLRLRSILAVFHSLMAFLWHGGGVLFRTSSGHQSSSPFQPLGTGRPRNGAWAAEHS